MLTGHCRNLSYLGICASNWGSCPRLDPLPPVEHLGICVSSPYGSVATICTTLATVQTPSIKVVHLMNKGMFEWFGSPQSRNTESAWGALAFHTFCVVDFEGRDLG